MVSVTKAKKDYCWRGDTFIALHAIGPYTVVEFWRAAADNDPDKVRRLSFGTYIDEKRCGRTYASLDEALAGCISRKHEGLNNHGDFYFIRAIGADLPEVRERIAVGTCDQCQEVMFKDEPCGHCAHREAA